VQQLFLNESVTARRRIPLFLFDDDAADEYAPKTGLTFSAAEIRVSKNGAAEVNSAGSVVEVAGGVYYYEATAAEVDTVGFLSVRPVKADVYGAPSIVQVIALNLYDAAGAGMSRLDATVSSRLASATYAAPNTLLTETNGVETGLTLQQALRLVVAAMAGPRSGIGTGTELYRDTGNTKSRVTMTFDAVGNTASVTYDAS
jgi:hypothetical protein